MAAANIDVAERSAPGIAARIDLRPGRVEALPVDDSSVDVVWSKDVLGLVENLVGAYSEFARVLRPGGRAIVYQSGLAADLTDREAALFWEPLDAVVSSSDPVAIEAAIEAGWVTDSDSAQRWIGDVLELSMARMSSPKWANG